VSVERNDVHSQLNPTALAAIVRPATLDELRQAILDARSRGLPVSIAGGCHAMGGQQFAAASINIDTTALTRVLHAEDARGLITIEAGADWPRILDATHAMPGQWAIRQKQTGVDAVTLGGSIAANAHGRGLLMQPIVDDIEDLTLVDADANVLTCSRTANAELFTLVVGGFGLFGVVSRTRRPTSRPRHGSSS
jgi:FAD/FMN-containing dehydrogenase